MTNMSDLRGLVRWNEGLISPAVLFDEEVYREEQERVFGHSWLTVGHEDMIRKPGDYITTYMGETPVILVRDMKNEIHVHVNKCVHRGNQVCLYDRGNARGFTCSYHGWTYDLTGDLIGVPMEKEIYRGELPKDEWGLEEVAKVTNFHGLIFANFDPEAISLEEWFGEDGCWWLENMVLVGHLGGLEMMPGFHRYQTPGNWKLLAENFIGDTYHVATTHAGAFRAGRELREKGKSTRKVAPIFQRGPEYEGSTGFLQGAPIGLGRVVVDETSYQHDLKQAERLGTEAMEWMEYRRNSLLEVMSDHEVKPYSFMNGGLFPNLGLMGFSSALDGRCFFSFHPRGVRDTEQWQWTMVERDAPDSVKEVALQYVYQGQHMAGLIAPDDGENFERVVEAMRDPRNWKRPFHYGLQLGHEMEGPRDLPGNIGPSPSEVNQRNFYRFWLELMEQE